MLRGLIIAALLMATAPALATERRARVDRETFACTSWAGWREYGQASLTARGARRAAIARSASRLVPA